MADGIHRAAPQPQRPEWYLALARYEKPDYRYAVRQVCLTVIPLLALLGSMVMLVQHGTPYGVILGMAVVASGLMTRSFIFLHDASHGAYFATPRANAVLGFLVGVLTLTPYGQWRWSHLAHHAGFANLDRRGVGDVKVLTVDEYRAVSPRARFVYRMYRHPLLLFGIGSTVLFGIIYRFPIHGAPPPARRSVWLTDLAILGLVAAAGLTIGLRPFFLVLAPIWVITWAVGVWLFYMQHQFAGVYWARDAEWDFIRAALEGSSYYRMPKVLQWFTGNIGLHHIHHLRPRIPNYRLQQALDETPAVQVAPLTWRGSVQALRFRLYDESRRQLVSFTEAAGE